MSQSCHAQALYGACIAMLMMAGPALAQNRSAVQISAQVVDACSVATPRSTLSRTQQVVQQCSANLSGSVQSSMRAAASLTSKVKGRLRLVTRPTASGKLMLVTISY